MAEEETGPAAMPEHVGQKIQTIAELFAKDDDRAGRHQLAIERITDAVGRPTSAYALSAFVLVWLLANSLAPYFGIRALDPPPFAWLQVAACMAALLMTVTILTTQNRVARLAQQRAQLDLQVNLIAEEKIAKLVGLNEELRRDLPSVKNRRDSLAEAMTEAVNLDAVAGELETIREIGPQKASATGSPCAPAARKDDA
jgi:uncharacterized membrane protein